MKTPQAQIHFNEQGTPVADQFDDVYYSNDSGIQETYHVFMTGNSLPQRWMEHSAAHFVIAETGFGTGLNCLVAMQAFARFRAANPDHPLKQLYLLSTEKFPLDKASITRALLAFPELAEVTRALLDSYPLALQGCHRLQLPDFHCSLDLWMGDVHDTLPQWHCPEGGLVDAWFLDGFAPSKNPDMWTESLFTQMARLAKANGTFATFTAAGVVKRGLKDAGFSIQKVAGFGRKRDMLIGHYGGPQHSPSPQPPYYRYHAPVITPQHRVAVIGGGLAGAAVACALVSKHIHCELFCASEQLAQGASGNPQGGFYPQLHAQASHASQIQAHSFLYASRVYRQLAEQRDFAHEFCGVLQLAFNEQVAQRQRNLQDQSVWPDALICSVSQAEIAGLAGLPLPYEGQFIGLGGWLNPPQLIAAMLAEAQGSGRLTIHTGWRFNGYQEKDSGVELQFDEQGPRQFDHLVLAMGHEIAWVDELQDLPFRAVRGQVEALPTQPPLDKLSTVLCHKGYLTPAWQGRHALGSTYIKQDLDQQVRSAESDANLTMHRQALKACEWVNDLNHDGQARAAIRMGLPDHQPAVGHVLDWQAQGELCASLGKGKPMHEQPLPASSRVSLLAGLGSRGLTTAPLLGELLASQLTHAPLPLPESLLQALNPNRFVIRHCIRGQGKEQQISDSRSPESLG